MARFKVYGQFSRNARLNRAIQTILSQRYAAEQKRIPKWFRRIHKRSLRFSLPYSAVHQIKRWQKIKEIINLLKGKLNRFVEFLTKSLI